MLLGVVHLVQYLGSLRPAPRFGHPRPLRRTIQRELDDELADLLLSGQFNPGDTAIADVVDGKLHITTSVGAENGVAPPAGPTR